jgi:nucleotide-binding universal stress UspA family protein
MTPFDSILVPIDFSPPSDRAVKLAADLSSRYGAALTLVHVYDPFPYALPEPGWRQTPDQAGRLISELEDRLKAAKRAAEAAGAARVTCELLQGPAASRIVEFAEANRVDLIVLGSHGRSGFERFMLGSVAERVSRLVSCSVLVARPPRSS